MSLSLSKRLYSSLGVAALIIAASVTVTILQVGTLAKLDHEADQQEQTVRKADQMMFWQTCAIAGFRGYQVDQGTVHRDPYRRAIEEEGTLYRELQGMLQGDTAAQARLKDLQARFEEWKSRAAEPVLLQPTAPKKADLSTFSIQEGLLPYFEAFMAGERAKTESRHTQATVARNLAERYALFGALIALGAGGSLLGWTIRGVRRELEAAIGTTASATGEIATTLSQQERTLAEQSSALNEVATTLAELSTTTTAASENGEAIGRRSGEASATASRWGDVVNENLGEMADLKENVDTIAKQILELSEQTGQIGTILGTVSDIANQTNMLALNAAVEAARAGEHGRGFAVVATEIRKLADQSKKALGRIGALVGQIQKATNSTVMAAEDGGKRVDTTLRKASESGVAIRSLLGALEETVLNTQQIVLNLKQQTYGVGQINQAVSSINLGMKETVAGLNQVKTGLQNLSDMGRSLRAMV
jgi:methyl-accepting chemotaxis protein